MGLSAVKFNFFDDDEKSLMFYVYEFYAVKLWHIESQGSICSLTNPDFIRVSMPRAWENWTKSSEEIWKSDQE